MAARNDREASVSARKPVGIVEYLDVPFAPLSEIDGVIMAPMVVILMKTDPPCTARGNIQRRMAEVIIGTYRRLQQCCNKGSVNKLVSPRSSVVPWPNKVCAGFARFALLFV